MKIVFFGSSHGVPEPNRKCSSIMLETGEKRYLIDVGTDVTEQLITRNIPLKEISAIFVTHMHGDHVNGLIPFVNLCNWAYKDADPQIFLPGDVDAAKAAVEAWLRCLNSVSLREFRYEQVKCGQVYDDGVIKVTAFATKHIAASYAYLVEAEGKRVLFSGDLSAHPQVDFPREVFEQPVDLAICESAHFEATEYLPIFQGNENLKRLCFNHYSDRHLASVLTMKNLLPELSVLIAKDGNEITL